MGYCLYNGSYAKLGNQRALVDSVGLPSNLYWPTDQLWAKWDLNGSTNDSYSTNNLTGTPISYSYQFMPGSFKKAARCGSGGVPNITNNVFINAFSLSFWFNCSATAIGPNLATEGNTYGQCGFDALIFTGTGLSYYGFSRSGYGGSSSTQFSYPVNSWNHFILTYDGSSGRHLNGYLNDVAVGGSNITYGTAFTQNKLCFGSSAGPSYVYWSDGYLANVFMYTKVLSSGERTQLYNSGQCI
jgi:hypothetical protein